MISINCFPTNKLNSASHRVKCIDRQNQISWKYESKCMHERWQGQIRLPNQRERERERCYAGWVEVERRALRCCWQWSKYPAMSQLSSLSKSKQHTLSLFFIFSSVRCGKSHRSMRWSEERLKAMEYDFSSMIWVSWKKAINS